MLYTTGLFRMADIENRLPHSSGAFVLLAKALDESDTRLQKIVHKQLFKCDKLSSQLAITQQKLSPVSAGRDKLTSAVERTKFRVVHNNKFLM